MTAPHTTIAPPEAAGTAVEEFEVLLVSDDLEPGYAVFCLPLPGCISQGDDRDDALAMITEAIEGFLDFLPPPERQPYEKDRLIAEYTADGCAVEVATVRVTVPYQAAPLPPRAVSRCPEREMAHSDGMPGNAAANTRR